MAIGCYLQQPIRGYRQLPYNCFTAYCHATPFATAAFACTTTLAKTAFTCSFLLQCYYPALPLQHSQRPIALTPVYRPCSNTLSSLTQPPNLIQMLTPLPLRRSPCPNTLSSLTQPTTLSQCLLHYPYAGPLTAMPN